MLLALPCAVACEGASGAGPVHAGEAVFRDVTLELGLPAPSGPPPDCDYFLPEVMQGGVGLFDHDLDGDLDLVHVRTPLPGTVDAVEPVHLYRQETGGTFRNVSEQAGLSRAVGFGQGLAVGDVENDGDPDLYIANFGRDAFFLNEGDGTFSAATRRAGFRGQRWSSACAFLDHDRDGFLDLYVVHYLRYEPERMCFPNDRRGYCSPSNFAGVPDKLYRNQGDGTFIDVTEAAGIVLPDRGARAMGLGVLCLDFTEDGLVDVFVANDMQSNQLWVNQGDGTFLEEGILRGVAVNPFGHPEASMGVTAGDANGDGVLDVFMTHLWQEHNRLYLGSHRGLFDDGTRGSRLERHDWERTGWGCGFLDFDNDGDVDLAVVNGGVRRRPALEGGPPGMWSEYVEPNQLYENVGGGEFVTADARSGTFATELEVSRGLALGDLDEDGDVDLVVANIDNTLRVYRNDAPRSGTHWLTVRALTHGRDALGAQVLVTSGGRVQRVPLLASWSYLSSNDPRAHFGLGSNATIEELLVLWPDGTRESFEVSCVDCQVTLRQGEGEAR